MTSLLADIRPDSWNFPLFLHVLGAIVLVATVAASAVALLAPGAADPAGLRRFGFRSLLFVGLPAYVVMRVGAEWLYSKEFGDSDDDPAWIGVGYITADIGAVLFLVALICAGIASSRSKERLGKVSGVLIAIALVGWLVAVWAMGAKPS